MYFKERTFIYMDLKFDFNTLGKVYTDMDYYKYVNLCICNMAKDFFVNERECNYFSLSCYLTNDNYICYTIKNIDNGESLDLFVIKEENNKSFLVLDSSDLKWAYDISIYVYRFIVYVFNEVIAGKITALTPSLV